MTECPSCHVDVRDLVDREECPECGTSREDIFALAAGVTPPSERDSGIRADPVVPEWADIDTNGGDGA